MGKFSTRNILELLRTRKKFPAFFFFRHQWHCWQLAHRGVVLPFYSGHFSHVRRFSAKFNLTAGQKSFQQKRQNWIILLISWESKGTPPQEIAGLIKGLLRETNGDSSMGLPSFPNLMNLSIEHHPQQTGGLIIHREKTSKNPGIDPRFVSLNKGIFLGS